MMRWSYARPEQKVFVFDGNRSWFYLPAEKQVTVTTLDEQRRGELPFLIIGDPAARVREERRDPLTEHGHARTPRGDGARMGPG